MDASLDKLEGEYEEKMERHRESIEQTNIIKHTPTADTPGAILSLPESHALFSEVHII